MADISLLFDVAGGGSLNGESGKSISSQLASIVGAINANPLKIKFQADKSSLDAMRSQVQEITKALDAKGTGLGINTETVSHLNNMAGVLKEIQATTASITSAYKSIGKSLGGATATGQNATDLEALKQKYIELMTAIESLRAAKASATQEDVANIYRLQTEMQTLISTVQERINLEHEAASAASAAAEEEARASERARAAQEEENKTETERLSLLRQAATLLTQMQHAEQTWTAAKNGRSATSYAAIQSEISSLQELIQEYNLGRISADEFKRKLSSLSTEFKINSAEIKGASENTKTFGERVGSLSAKFGTWFSITRVIMAVYRTMRKMVSASIELDDAMTQLQIVTRETDDTLQRFGDNIAETAKKIGASITDLVSSATTFARLGYSLEESSMLAEYTSMLQNVGDIDVTDAQNAITAIVKAFDIDVDEIESVMDKLVITGNNFPISVSQIAEGMNNASSTLAAAGNSFEQSVALLTAANTTVQNAAKSSTGLRTIAARIRNTKSELDELGETMTEANYEDLVQQLTDFQVALTDANGEYRSTYDIMSDIAAKWSTMNSMQQAALATALSGTRQQAVFYSIIEQFQEASGAMDAMSDSAGTLQESYSTFLESTTAHINSFKAAFQQLSAGVFESGFLQFFIDLGTGIINFLNGIDNVIDKLGGFKTVILGVAAALLIAKGGLIAYKVQMIATAAVQKIITFFTGVKTAILTVINIIPNAIIAWKSYAAGVVSASTAMQASIPVIGLVLAAITLLVGALSLFNSTADEAKQKARDASKTAADGAKELSADVAELTAEYLELSEAVKTDSSVKEKLLSVQDKLIEKLEIEKSRVEELVEEYGNYADAIRAASVEKLKEAERDLRGGINTYKEELIEAAEPEKLKNKPSSLPKNYKSNLVHIWGMNATIDDNWSTADARALKALQGNSAFKVSAGNNALGSGLYTIKIAGMDEDDLDNVNNIVTAYEKLGTALDIVSDAAGSENVIYKALYEQYNNVKDALNNYSNSIGALNENLAEQYMLNGLMGKEIPTTQEEFDAYRDSVVKAAKESGQFVGRTKDIENAVDGVLSKQAQFAGFYQDQAVEASGAAISLNDLSGSAQELKSAYDILAKAEEEMVSGGLSADTIKAMADSTKDYLSYLYEENGVIKLNTSAWKEYASAKMAGDIAKLQTETERLREEREELEKQLEYWQGVDGRYRSKSENVEKYTSLLNENTDALERNERLLGIYSSLFDDMTGSLNAYTEALSNFTNIASAIDSVSNALTTVADLQETVANGFTISLEKALEFASVYPEILNGATVSADGQIALNESVVNAFIEGKEAELKAQVDAKIAELESEKGVLTAKMQFAQAELDLAKSVGEGEGQISQELAEYRVNAGNAVAQALIEAGIDEATAYQLAMAAMSQNSEEFNRIAAQVCTDVDGNFNSAAYSAAQAIYNNMKNASSSLDGIIRAAHNAAAAIAGIGSGTQAGSTGSFSGSGGTTSGGAKITLSQGTFNGVDYSYTPKTVSLDQFISDLELDISSYSNAIAQIDGQIATLKALRNTSLNKFSTSAKKGSSGGSGGSGSGSSGKDEESWFEQQYKLHNHLLKMDSEDMEDYLVWLNGAYKQAYSEGIITLDDYRKYQEEVFSGLRDVFKDYLNDIEHEISMRENYDGESKKIISLYKTLISKVEAEIAAARKQGLTDEDDYIQELQDKWQSYKKAIKDIQEDITDAAKDALDDLVDYRIDMLKKDIENEKDALDKKLDNLKDFYDKQKEMLQDAADEEKYLDEQAEKRKSVSDIQAELQALQYDDSAWAQKRKLELNQELADAQKDLEDFEKEHALDLAIDAIDAAYDAQEAQINAEMAALEEKLNDPQALFNQALTDIKNNSKNQLYYTMLMYNRQYGDGKDSTVNEMWEKAYGALDEYQKLFGKAYEGVTLKNETGYTPNTGWDTAPVSDKGSSKSSSSSSSSSTKSTTTTTTTPKLDDATKRKVAAAIWNGGYGWGHNPDRAKRLTEVFGANNGIQDLVNRGVGKNDSAPGSAYTYLNMRKKFKGYWTGTRKASAGFHSLDELGTETIFESADGTKYKMFTGGEKVLNAKASNFLYDFATGGGDILSKIIRDVIDGGLGGINQPLTNNEIRMGDIIVQGNADRATVSEIRRAQRESLETMLKELNKLNR